MPEKRTLERARRKARAGKSPSTVAGEFVREEMEDIRKGKHGARSAKQAIAIGLSKARRAGVNLGPPPKGSQAARKARHSKRRRAQSRPSGRRARAIARALRREPQGTVSRRRLARQTHRAAQRRGAGSRHAAARKAVRTKGRTGLRRAARKAARSRQQHR
ncbi:MAG TPA: DUF6496 domain-containing protein [Burkholderiales bacterium]|nr:DUF6496 domain-containing protein [Burkholderiales bacterium]